MACYTCTTENRGHSHISQHLTDSPEDALSNHIKSLPFIEGINPIGDELYWLQNIALGKIEVTLRLLAEFEHVWKWSEGEDYLYPYTTYIVKTDTRK
jgi:hypothetical protein